MCQRNLKKLIVLILLVSVGMYSLARADDVATIRQNLVKLGDQLDKLKKLKDQYNGKKKEQQQQAGSRYVSDAKKIWGEFQAVVASLESSLESYSSNLEPSEAFSLKGRFSTLKAASDKIGDLINNGRPTEGVNNFFTLEDAIKDVRGLIPLSDPPKIQSSPTPPRQQASPPVRNGDIGHSDDFSIPDSLLYALGTLLTLAGIGAAFFWLNRRIVAVERSQVQQNEVGAQTRQNVKLQLDGFLDDYQKQRNQDQQSQQAEYSRLQNEIEHLRAKVQSAKARAVPESPTIRRQEEPLVERMTHTPAALAAPRVITSMEYLTRAGNNAIRAKAVMFRPEILQQADDDGPFVLMPDSGSHDLYKVIPGVPRFQSSQDYSHFAYFYDCDSPTSGELLIVEPALARYDSSMGQWTLHRKGRLQLS